MYLLFNCRTNQGFHGATRVDAVLATGLVRFNFDARRITVADKLDTMSFGRDYIDSELPDQFARRAVTLLACYGFLLFVPADPS